MTTLMRLLLVVAFGVIGGGLIWTDGTWIDGQLHPRCELVRHAGVALFGTFVLVFGVLGIVWPVSDERDSALPY